MGFPDSSVGKESTCNAGEPVGFLDREIHWRRDRLNTQVFLGFNCGSAEESACNARDLGSAPGLWRSPGEGKGYPVHCSGLENSMDCIVYGVTKSRTWLSDIHLLILLKIDGHLNYTCDLIKVSVCVFSFHPISYHIWWNYYYVAHSKTLYDSNV